MKQAVLWFAGRGFASRRRVTLTITVVALLMFTSVALAATKYCSANGICYGTSFEDVFYGPDGNDRTYGE